MLTASYKCIVNRHARRTNAAFGFCMLMLLFSHGVCMAQDAGSRPLFSPFAARRFYDLAYELANSSEASLQETDQALTFLKAVMELDNRAGYALPDMIRFASRERARDHSELMHQLLSNYLDKSVDLEVVGTALSYLVERSNTREERERLLANLLIDLTGKNSILESEIATKLALLTAEKADLQSAQFLLGRALDKNKYNKAAFAKLVELAGDRIKPAVYLEHLRLRVGENPFDMEAALAFARYSEQIQLYDIAAEAYEYCAELFAFLRPSELLPASIYLPWAISCYNTERSRHKCLQIAGRIRGTGRFDLLLEAIAGRAAAETGDPKLAADILRTAAEKAMSQTDVPAAELGWFYSFAMPDPNNAVDWANKAYAADASSATAASLLAYALVLNGQTDWPELLLENYPPNQIADLTMALIQLAAGQKDSGIETLKSAIARDPGSLAGHRAKEILAREGGQYLPPADPGVVLTVLRAGFGQSIVPVFINPAELISVQLNLAGTEFSYDTKLDGAVIIKNNSSGPLVISDDALFKGNIRIDAHVSGDIEENIPNLISTKTHPSSPVAPGQSVSISAPLAGGRLGRILGAHPQASLEIEFTVFLDPVIAADGSVANRLIDIPPAKVVVKRPPVPITTKYLQNRLNSIAKGRQGQKIKSAQLFTGLLMEQIAAAKGETSYNIVRPDWMPEMLKSALAQALTDEDWVVRVYTMAGMLSLPLDYELTQALSNNLSDAHWPSRMTALFVLGKTQGGNFSEVLDWTAQYDSNELVRQMAVALGGKQPPERQPSPPAAPSP
ncbi:MAG: hypothetical protein ACYTBJ_11330 [Planctomycetota bacterium]|jgi:hypothetical protein